MPTKERYAGRTAELREYERRNKYKSRYGITYEECEALKAKGCALCGTHERLCIDHDHATGKVRAALCLPCNTKVGDQTSEDVLRMLAYLIEHEEVFR